MYLAISGAGRRARAREWQCARVAYPSGEAWALRMKSETASHFDLEARCGVTDCELTASSPTGKVSKRAWEPRGLRRPVGLGGRRGVTGLLVRSTRITISMGGISMD